MKAGGERELQKFQFGAADNSKVLNTLEDQDDDEYFDQFKGKKTTYKDEIYNSKIDYSKVTDKDRAKAEAVEKAILQKSADGNVHL